MLNNYTFCGYIIFSSLTCLIFLVSGDCPFPKRHIPNGRLVYENPEDKNLTLAPENYILQFRCNKGYERTEPEVISCLDGEWTDRLPRCMRLQCQNPLSIEHGFYELTKGVNKNPTLGSSAVYHCDAGFEFENASSNILHCTLEHGRRKAHWKGEMPKCIEKTSCPDPGVSPNGFRRGDCCHTGDKVTYKCIGDAILVGPESIECLHGGVWSAPRPRCKTSEIHCDDPPVIPNGLVKGDKAEDYYVAYEEVEIECDSGFAYNGLSEFVMCEEEGDWEEDFGECTESFCGFPELPMNGTILELENTNATEFPSKFELTYVCDPGFRLIGESFRTCEKKDWSPEAPRCEVIKCPDPCVPNHGTRSGDNFNIGEKVVFKCYAGFELIGSVERYCMPNGQWTGELTRCNTASNYCPDPGTPISGTRNSTSCNMGDKIGFACQNGFSLIGSSVRECLPDKTWSGVEAKCLGPYDFDNTKTVSDTLKETVAEKAEEHQKKLKKYTESSMIITSRRAMGLPTIRGRILDVNYNGRLVLYFLFDVSGSVKEVNFRTSINFAKALVKKVGISPHGARAGAMTFSSKTDDRFMPVDYSTTEEVLNALDQIPFTGGGTALNTALRDVLEQYIPLTQEVFGKKGLKSVVFILTDGKANTGGDPEVQAKKLKKAGVEIYCIGITGSPRAQSLYKIASVPLEEHVFILNSYKTMKYLIQEITSGTIDYSECGLGLEKVAKRLNRAKVAGGKKAGDPWPWMAALYMAVDWSSDPSDAELQCGGSIIHKQWILTAAHCLYKKDSDVLRKEKLVTVKLGLTDVKNLTSLQEFEVEKFYIHPNYHNLQSYDYDIALLKLKVPIEFNAFVRPICLPEKLSENTTLYKPQENAYATGWGQEASADNNQEEGKTVDVLKELRLPIQTRERCLAGLRDQGGSEESFTERMFCAGTGQGGEDTCQGDSGGPLMQSLLNADGNVFWTQVGIVSWGIGCAEVNSYGYYTHVHKLYQWVKSVMNSTNAD